MGAMATLDDVEEIRQLLARYCHLGDSLDSGGLAQCFTNDAVIDANGVRTVGRDAIRESVEAYRPVYAATPLRHVTTNVLVEVNGDEAQSTSYYMLLATGAEPRVLRIGTYRDQLRRVDGRWLLSERVATSDGGPATAPAVRERDNA
jgi:uncharacterized protein (TIGR02246 family)